jgi:polysaccharide biosynthesis transport protein
MQLKSNQQESNSIEFLDLQLYWTILKRHWTKALAVFALVLIITTGITLTMERVYRAEGKLLLKKKDATTSITGLGKEIGEKDSLARLGNPIDTEAEVISSAPLVIKTISELKIKDDENKLLDYEKFINNLKVNSTRGTDILVISYKSPNPDLSAAVVNKLMDLYVENNNIDNRAEATAVREFIESQLPKIDATVRQAANSLRSFKEVNNIVDVEEEAKSVSEALISTEKQIIQSQSALTNANARSIALREKLGLDVQGAMNGSTVSQSAGVQKALEEFQAIESKLALDQARFQESSPEIVDLKNRRAAARSVLEKRIIQTIGNQKLADQNLQFGSLQRNLTEQFVTAEIERFSLSSQLSTLSRQFNVYKQRAHNVPRLNQQQRHLAQALMTAESSYQSLSAKLQDVRLTERQELGNVRIIQPALLEEKPVSPKLSLNLLVGGLVGLLLGLLTVVLLEAKDTSIKTVKEARELMDFDLLGIIPEFKKRLSANKKSEITSAIPVRDYPRSQVSEACRTLYTTLRFLSLDRGLKVFTVTSSVPKEGKSTIAANLSAAAAEADCKVLLIDADMRCPAQHEIWNIPNKMGLSDVISGDTEFSVIVRKESPNLHILTAGNQPSNPVVLLSSKQMTSLMKELSKVYDFIIIDTPPLLVAADSAILGRMSDGLLMIVRPEVARQDSISRAKDMLGQLGQKVLGQIVNGVAPKHDSEHYFRAYDNHYYTESNHRKIENHSSKSSDISHRI